jgi:hypothetical protein
MSRLGTFRNVVAIVLLPLAVLPACSTQRARQTQEQQETVEKPARSQSKANESRETAGQATLVVLMLGRLGSSSTLPERSDKIISVNQTI